MDQYIGKLINGRYELQERIGSNWMTITYKAHCHRLDRLVAVEILRDELAMDAGFRRRFHNQYQAMVRLSSYYNIVTVYDVGYSDGDKLEYIVTEFVDGITLEQYMQRKGRKLNWREALHFVTCILEGLSYAHSRGIIHQCIAPQNIMVLRDGSVKINNFGTIQLFSMAPNTLKQATLAFAHYISPEQTIGGNINACSDIYSTGVLLYEMLTGHWPFERGTLPSVTLQHSNSNPLQPRKLDPDIPEALEIITMKAMATNVNQRYTSAHEMLVDLKKCRRDLSNISKNSKTDFRSKTVCMPKSKDGKLHKNQHGFLHLLIPSVGIVLLISGVLVVEYFFAEDQTSIYIRQVVKSLINVAPPELNITFFGILLTIASFFVESKTKKALCISSIIFLIISMLIISIILPFEWLNFS